MTERPDGLVYAAEFIAAGEEAELLASLAAVEFEPVVMRGYMAKRTVRHFGLDYGYDSRRLDATDPLPSFLEPLRGRVAAAMGCTAEQLEEVLLSRYEKGAGIGWHRDAPMFGDVGGVSVGADCVLRFRNPKVQPIARYNLLVQARSFYLLSGSSRWQWQHSIDAAPALRYSITFRTLRRKD